MPFLKGERTMIEKIDEIEKYVKSLDFNEFSLEELKTYVSIILMILEDKEKREREKLLVKYLESSGNSFNSGFERKEEV